MAFKSRAVVLVANTPTDLLAAATLLKNGTVTDPTPIQVVNTSATAVLIGGPDISTGNGFPLVQNVPFTVNAYSNDYPWVLSAGTPTINILVGRQ